MNREGPGDQRDKRNASGFFDITAIHEAGEHHTVDAMGGTPLSAESDESPGASEYFK
jgi:hypothetical protein